MGALPQDWVQAAVTSMTSRHPTASRAACNCPIRDSRSGSISSAVGGTGLFQDALDEVGRQDPELSNE